MTIFAGKTWIVRMINRWHAKATLGALLRRADNHFLDDIGVARDDLRRAFGDWRNERRVRAEGFGPGFANVRVVSAQVSLAAADRMPQRVASAARSLLRSRSHARAAGIAR